MSNVAFDGADIAELLFVGFAFKNFAQRFDFNGVAHGSAGAMRFDVADGLRRNIGVGLGHGNRFGLAVDARREERSRTRAIVVLSRAANHGIDGVAIGESVGETLEHNYARAVAEHGSGRIGVEGTAVTIFGEGAAFLIEETALLWNGDVNAAGKSDVTFVVEQRAVGLIDRQKGGGTGGIEADSGAAKVQEIGGAKSDVVFLVSILDGKLAGHGEQIGVAEKICGEVVVVANTGENADALLGALGIVARVLECVLCQFEEDALLRIGDFGFERTNAKESGVEKIGPIDQTSSADVVGIIAKIFVDSGTQLFGLKEGDGFDGIAEVLPELIEIGCAREASDHTNYGDSRGGRIIAVLRFALVAGATCDFGKKV